MSLMGDCIECLGLIQDTDSDSSWSGGDIMSGNTNTQLCLAAVLGLETPGGESDHHKVIYMCDPKG